MYTLSGGQKSRVAFAKVTFSKPHILLLDEPSNHLDLDAVNALIQVSFSPTSLAVHSIFGIHDDILLLKETSSHLDLDAVNALIQVSCGPPPLCSAQLWPCLTLQGTAVALPYSAVHSCGPSSLCSAQQFRIDAKCGFSCMDCHYLMLCGSIACKNIDAQEMRSQRLMSSSAMLRCT